MAKKLRKVNVRATTLQNNAASFVNESADDLHIRKIELRMRASAATAIGDMALASLDEVPAIQDSVTDSRSHITSCVLTHGSGTGSLAPDTTAVSILTFERGQLVLEPDEALFLNTADLVGAMPTQSTAQIWYED